MNRMGFLERSDGVAFWTVMLLSFAFLIFSYAITQVIESLLLLVIITAGLIFRSAWTIYGWRRPSSIEMEKVERASFWMISLTILIVLILQYTTANSFDYYVFYVFIIGLITKYFVFFINKRRGE
jgi:hypothetical protein